MSTWSGPGPSFRGNKGLWCPCRWQVLGHMQGAGCRHIPEWAQLIFLAPSHGYSHIHYLLTSSAASSPCWMLCPVVLCSFSHLLLFFRLGSQQLPAFFFEYSSSSKLLSHDIIVPHITWCLWVVSSYLPVCASSVGAVTLKRTNWVIANRVPNSSLERVRQ